LIYTEELLDRRTGEMTTINIGDWITVTEFGDLVGAGPRKVRTVLRDLEFLAVEGGRDHNRHRITDWAVRDGLGRRINPTKRMTAPFDVISPTGQEWLKERWSAALSKADDRVARVDVRSAKLALVEFQTSRSRLDMPVQESVCWLADHHPLLSQDDVACILDITRQLVSRHQLVQAKQRREGRYFFGGLSDG
jgi:hypothetical protein